MLQETIPGIVEKQNFVQSLPSTTFTKISKIRNERLTSGEKTD